MSFQNSEIIVGIDLGTTNSAVAVMENGVPRLIQIDGQPTMPSCVGVDESGGILVGQPAVNQMAAAPERTITSVKRRMGEDLPISLGEKQYQPEEISAFILKRLKAEAENDLDRPVTKAVITVPAYFNEKQRRATQNAAELAGLEAVRILNEPTAAALAYNLQNSKKQTILVYDLGGGTFDVSLVSCLEGLVEVRSSHGDSHLGGDDFDEALVKHITESWEGKNALDLSDPQISRRLTTAAEMAKCKLSDQPFETIREDYLAEDRHHELELARIDFEQLIEPMLEKTLESMHQALTDGEVLPRDVDQILLVGGSTRIPLVQQMIEHRMGMAVSREVDPDLIVAMGAAIQGGIIAGEEVGSILVDISTQTFSNLAHSDQYGSIVCIPIIQRGSPLPVTRSEAFTTTMDKQKKIEIVIFQGESINPDENIEIGQFEVTGLKPVPAGNIIIIEYSLDSNGMLEVTAQEKATGLQKAVTIDTRNIEASFDLEEARKRMSEAFGDDDLTIDISEPEAGKDDVNQDHKELTRAKDLKKRAEALLKQEIDPDDSKDLQSLLEESLAAVKSRDFSKLNELSDQLEDIIFYLEE